MIIDLELDGARLIYPEVFNDNRGFFFESYNERLLSDNGIDVEWVQDNHSGSVRNTLRGLHYQEGLMQAKLIRVVSGKIFDVIVDLRPESETFGRWAGAYLDAIQHGQMYCPPGFAHGFYTLSEFANVCYKVSTFYYPETECTLQWNDPDIAVEWPTEVFDPLLSARDSVGELFSDYKARIIG